MRGAGGENNAQFKMRIKWHLLLNISGLWCLFSASPPRFLCILDNTSHGPALQSEEMTLPSLQRLCLSALDLVCPGAGAEAARRLPQPPGCVCAINWDQPGTPPHHPAVPLGTLNLPVAIGKAERSLKVGT